jgi:hypothetical protein
MTEAPLLLAAFALAIGCAILASVTRRGLEVNHVLTFAVGYCFYWLLPIAVGVSGVFSDWPEVRWWMGFFEAARRSGHLETYLTYVVAIFVAYAAGSALGARVLLPVHRGVRVWLPFDRRLLYAYLPIGVAAAAFYAAKLRDQLFAGYAGDYVAGGLARGTLAAASTFLLSLALLHRAYARDSTDRGRVGWYRRGDGFMLAYIASAALLVSLGVRLYVVATVFALMTFYSAYSAPLPLRRAVPALAALIVAAGAVGLLRQGTTFSPFAAAVNIVAEPMFTSFSLLDYVRRGDFPLWNAPRFLMSDIINLIPSAILPGKTQLLLRPEDYGYTVFAPLGAVSSFFSFMINFGLVGTLLFMFALGSALGVLRRLRDPLSRVIYSMLSACLAFTFFRDGFSVSLVKNMLEFSVLVPIAVAVSLHVVTEAARPRPGARLGGPVVALGR